MCFIVCVRGFRFDERQCVVDLNVRVAEFEPVEEVVGLAVCRSKEIATGYSTSNRLCQDLPTLEPRRMEISKRILAKTPLLLSPPCPPGNKAP